MDFRYLHIYRDDSIPAENLVAISEGMRKIFSGLDVDVRDPFQQYWGISGFGQLREEAGISDIRQPLDKQVKQGDSVLYDGYFLQKHLGDAISEAELDASHVHAILTTMLACTFDEDDWRYHARTVICGTPSIISLAGIVEAPAKPREYYYLNRPGLFNHAMLKEKFAGRFIDYGDERIFTAALGYIVQAAFYFLADGRPFCADRNCMLYNSHWQEDMIRTLVEKAKLCAVHEAILNKFNARQDLL